MNSRKKIYISIIVFLVLNVLLVALFIIPILINIGKNSEDLVLQKGELARLKGEIKTFEEAESVYENSKGNIGKIEALFYDPDNPFDFLNFINEKPKSYGLENEISRFLADPDPQPGFWKSHSLQIKSMGPLTSLMKFIENLESGPYLAEVINISIKKISADGSVSFATQKFSPGDISASLSIKVYSK